MRGRRKSKKPVSCRIKVDSSEWDLGEWPGQLYKSLEIEKTSLGVDICISPSAFDVAARKIAEQAVKDFFEDKYLLLDEKGLRFSDAGGDDVVEFHAIPLEEIMIWGPLKIFDGVIEWLKRELREYSASDKEGQDRIIAIYRKLGCDPPTFDQHGAQKFKG